MTRPATSLSSGTLLSEIARATFSYDDFKTVTDYVWRNVELSGALWRVVYKSLNLLDYLLRHGSERCIEDARDHTRELKRLLKFEFIDATAGAKDQGANIREKAPQSPPNPPPIAFQLPPRPPPDHPPTTPRPPPDHPPITLHSFPQSLSMKPLASRRGSCSIF